MNVTECSAYEKTGEEWIAELNSQAVLYRHKKTGARVFTLSNDDDNKVFMIGFRTPVTDSTGVPHIMEHSVLCGSEKYPVKDPFVELAKGSLNTFLNAMTYPDKTVYPVASCNDKDFHNLMDIYLDAVFHPNIYHNEKIFRQEGWHYEMENADSELTINGVVYNEMKGALSSPESLLDSFTLHTLYPDTTYTYESGGDPDVIPTLSYEKFLDFHRTYYHPSNSYLYLYGNMNMEEQLKWIDEEYLSRYSSIEVDSEIHYQAPFAEKVQTSFEFPITEDQDETEETYLSVNTVVGDSLNPVEYLAFPVLEYALLNAPGAPLKEALLDAGMGDDIFGGYETDILQPYFSVTAKGADRSRMKEFTQLVETTLRKLADEGINRKLLLAGINNDEFKYREADFGPYPRGLMYGLQCFDSWLYGEGDPLMHLKYQESFDYLKENLEKGYFEDLIRRHLLDNPHTAEIIGIPRKGMLAEKEEKLAALLADRKASWSREECEACAVSTAELKQYQSEPSPREDLEKIPMLTREDIGKKCLPLDGVRKEVEGIPVLHSEMFTSGIGYLHTVFDLREIEAEDLPVVGFLKAAIGLMDTEHYSYLDLNNEINIESGGIVTSTGVYPVLKDTENFIATYEFSAKVFYEKIGFVLEMIEEMACHTSFRDEKRLLDVLNECKARAQSKLMSSGHSAAVLRAASYQISHAVFSEKTAGISYYQFLQDMIDHFAEKKDWLMEHCEAVCRKLFCRKNLMIAYTANAEGYEKLTEELPAFLNRFPVGEDSDWFTGEKLEKYHPVRKQEGFKTSSGVQYVARCGNFRRKGLPFTGVLRIGKIMLEYDYLWLSVRVKGGAYGAMAGFDRVGNGHFVSYRDPNLGKTNEIYEGIPAYFEQFDGDERDMTQFIIGTIAALDTPLNPSAKGNRALGAYMSGLTEETIQKERDEILNANAEDIRGLAAYAAAVLEDDCFCVVGGENKIEEEKNLFKEVKPLFG